MKTSKLRSLGLVIAIATTAAVGLSAQQSVTLEGTLVDSKCYLGDNSLKGDDHGPMAGCGAACLRMGQPAGLVTSDSQFHTIIAPASALAAHVGHTIRVTGTMHNGSVLATKVEMNNNGSWQEVKLGGMM